MEPTRLFPIIVLLSLVTVEYGGWALLGFLTGHGTLGTFRERLFRAGHAHAGVLLGTVAGLFPLPGPGRLLHRRAVAARRAAAGRRAGPVRRFLRAPGAGPAGPQFARHGADPGRGTADSRGLDHLGHRPDHARMKGRTDRLVRAQRKRPKRRSRPAVTLADSRRSANASPPVPATARSPWSRPALPPATAFWPCCANSVTGPSICWSTTPASEPTAPSTEATAAGQWTSSPLTSLLWFSSPGLSCLAWSSADAVAC